MFTNDNPLLIGSDPLSCLQIQTGLVHLLGKFHRISAWSSVASLKEQDSPSLLESMSQRDCLFALGVVDSNDQVMPKIGIRISLLLRRQTFFICTHVVKCMILNIAFGALNVTDLKTNTSRVLFWGGTASLTRNYHVLCSISKLSTHFWKMIYAFYSKLSKELTNTIKI